MGHSCIVQHIVMIFDIVPFHILYYFKVLLPSAILDTGEPANFMFGCISYMSYAIQHNIIPFTLPSVRKILDDSEGNVSDRRYVIAHTSKAIFC